MTLAFFTLVFFSNSRAPTISTKNQFVNAFVPYQIARNIQRAEERPSGLGLTFDDIKDRLFSSIPHGQLRIRIKTVANFERTNNGIWSIKAVGEDDFPGVEALGRKVSSGTTILNTITYLSVFLRLTFYCRFPPRE